MLVCLTLCAINLQIIYNTIVILVSEMKKKRKPMHNTLFTDQKKDPGRVLIPLQKVLWELYCPGRSRLLPR